MPVDPRPILLLRTLGELRLVDAAGGDLLAGRRKELVLLAYLARRRPRLLARAELATLLWGDRPEANARASLRQALLHLKRALGDGIRADNETVSLAASALELDLTAFEAAISARRFAEAVALWRGDFLSAADDAGDEGFRLWLDEERQRSRHGLAWAYEQLVVDSSRRAARDESIRWATAWAEALPLDEKAHVHLIRTLRAGGRIGDARGQYAAFVARYRDVFDADPSPEVLRLAAESQDAPAATPTLPVARTRVPLVGRGDVFARVVDAWDAACTGAGSVVIVDGSEGIGKTRLCDEFVRWIADREVVVLRATPPEGDGQSWETLRTLLAGVEDAPGLLGISAVALAELSRLVPTLRERIRHLPEPSADDFALRDAVVQALAAVSSELPTAIVLDDADRVDDATWRALAMLAARVANMRVLVLLTTNIEAATRASRLTTLAMPLERLQQLSLGNLDVDEVDQLVTTVTPLPVAECRALAMRLHAEVDGNPRFVLDTVAELVAARRLVRDARGAWQLASPLDDRPLPVPESLRGAILRRLARVSADARLVAELLAAAGPAAGVHAVRASGLSVTSLYAALDELVARRLLAPDIARTDAIRPEFASPAVRQAITQSLPSVRRAELQHLLDAGTATASGVRMEQKSGGGRRAPSRRLAWRAAIAAVMGAAFLVTAARMAAARHGHAESNVVAVGLIRGLPDDSGLAGTIADMLATNLARVPSLRMLSNARMLEVARQLRAARGRAGADDQRRRIVEAAELAGAREVIEGELYREASDTLRLDLRRVDVASGEVREAVTVRATSAFRLVDAATAQMAPGPAAAPDTLRISDVSTSSLAAYRLYEEGLRALYQESDGVAAKRFFTAASREDSTFAMAWYYIATLTGGGPGAWPFFERADRLAEHASDRERLLIRTSWALERNAPSVVPLAETLAVRYPDEPDALLATAAVRSVEGRFMDAVEGGRRVLAMDAAFDRRPATRPAAAGGAVERCRACDALQSMSSFYWLADSMPAMIRTAEEFVRLRPRSAGAWNMLAWTNLYAGRDAEALAAYRRQEALGTGGSDEFPSFFLAWAITSGNFAGADELLQGMIGSGVSTLVSSGLWDYGISLRQQGRLAEALRIARRQRAIETQEDPSRKLTYDGSITEALTLFEMGRFREAAAHFDTIATASAPTAASLRYRAARHRVWMLTQAATALAAAGDTAAVRCLADTIQHLGTQSSYGRDRRLHHHVRGLLYEMRGQPEQAVSEFRQAAYSWSLGYTRTNLELARMLLQLHRPGEAVAPLRSALHGGLDANNLYVTRTELQEMLARAFEAAGQGDSARVYYDRVAKAWAHADPQFTARAQEAERRARRGDTGDARRGEVGLGHGAVARRP